MKQLKKIAAAVLIAAMLGLLLPQLGVNAEALKRGSRGDLVRQLQTRLRSWGYYSGTVDGVYGAKTESAVRAFQKRNGLTADGIVGQKTAAALGLNLPSSTGGGSAASSNGNLYLLARLVHGEARGEPYKGKVAVAAVVLNRVRSASFPNTIAGVIYQSGAFDAVSDGQINLAPDDYYQMLLSILEAYILPQEGEIYFSVKDLENMPVGFGKEIEEIAKKYDIDINLLNDIIGEYEYSGILDTGKIKEKIDKPLIEKVNITKSIKDFIVNLINRFK